jgi:hypothetical protein
MSAVIEKEEERILEQHGLVLTLEVDLPYALDLKHRVARHGMSLQSDLGARELEDRYLTQSSGPVLRAWGAFRIALARRES